MTSGYDFFGGHAVYVEGFAQDGLCKNSLRQLTVKEVIKHVGLVKDFRTWWVRILSKINLVANDLAVFISEAQDIELDFVELPFSPAAFYELLGFPEYLAERAAADAEANTSHPFDRPFTIDMWTLHSGGTYALTHFFQGKGGAALDRNVRVANDILFNPEGTVGRVVQAFKDRLISGEGSQSTIEGKQGLGRIERLGDDIRTKAQQFESREEALWARFQQAMSYINHHK